MIRVVQSCIGRFHHFHLARELHRRGALACIFTGYPWFRLAGEGLPREKVRTFPWLRGFRMGCGRVGLTSPSFIRELEQWSLSAHDRFTWRNLPPCDAFVGLSGMAGATGRKAQAQGALYVCDRGSTHIRFQSRIMAEEAARWGLGPKFGERVDPRTVEREEDEYQTADYITVPSEFTRRSFILEGVPAEKVIKIAYGADIGRFRPMADPSADSFDVLFVGGVSLRKGALDLIDAFNQLPVRRKRLTFIGKVSPVVVPLLRTRRLEQVTFLGPAAHGDLAPFYSRAHVLALPSLEEGLAMVMGEAMACGCPVVATENSGAEDLFEHNREGFIIGARQVGALAQKLQQLSDDRELRARMSAAALARTKAIGGWSNYGGNYFSFLHQQVDRRRGAAAASAQPGSRA